MYNSPLVPLMEKYGVQFVLRDALAGAVFALICLYSARIIVKAIIGSWLGKKNGNIVSTLVEVMITIFFISKAYQNPGYIVILLAFSAGIFRQLVGTMRGW